MNGTVLWCKQNFMCLTGAHLVKSYRFCVMCGAKYFFEHSHTMFVFIKKKV